MSSWLPVLLLVSIMVFCTLSPSLLFLVSACSASMLITTCTLSFCPLVLVAPDHPSCTTPAPVRIIKPQSATFKLHFPPINWSSLQVSMLCSYYLTCNNHSSSSVILLIPPWFFHIFNLCKLTSSSQIYSSFHIQVSPESVFHLQLVPEPRNPTRIII